MSKRFRAALPTGGRRWPRGGGARGVGGLPWHLPVTPDWQALWRSSGLGWSLQPSVGLVAANHSPPSRVPSPPLSAIPDPSPRLEGVGGRRDACRGLWGCPGPQLLPGNPCLAKAAGRAQFLEFFLPSWGASEEGCGAWRGSGVRAGTVPALLNAASRASRIAGALEGILVLAEERWEGGRKGRLR